MSLVKLRVVARALFGCHVSFKRMFKDHVESGRSYSDAMNLTREKLMKPRGVWTSTTCVEVERDEKCRDFWNGNESSLC